MALLYSLLSLRENSNLRLHVAHLNHNFRGDEADEDAAFVSEVARDLGLPSTVEKGDPVAYQRKMGVSSFEEAAREVRYDFLSRVSADSGAVAVALGHTADDLAETVNYAHHPRQRRSWASGDERVDRLAEPRRCPGGGPL